MKKFRQINIERLREVLNYDALTGSFWWRSQLSNRARAGSLAGCVMTGNRQKQYIGIRFDWGLHTAHRLAWAHYHGEAPPPEIDHVDGNGLNNAIVNLRASTRSQNAANMRKTILPVSGFRGVYPYGTTGKRFEAKAMKSGKTIHFGVFDTREDAYAAYCKGAESLFGEFASIV